MSNSKIISLNLSQDILTEDNILEYFETYVKSYVPYKDKPVFRAFMEFIIKNYVDIIYNIQPAKFKELFEHQTITADMIDVLLVSVGLPQNLINDLSITTKLIIMKSFSDFEKYKGTIKFVREMGGSLSDIISYYELYIDFDENYLNPPGEYLVVVQKDKITKNSYFLISSTYNNYYIWFNFDNSGTDPLIKDRIGIEIPVNSQTDTSRTITQKLILDFNLTGEFYVKINANDLLDIKLSRSGAAELFNRGTTQLKYTVLNKPVVAGSWILRPKPIYINPKMTQNESTIRYIDAYNKLPRLLIPEEQLNNLKAANNIVLPVKSNILLLDYSANITSSVLNTLFFTLIMDYIGEDFLALYMSDSDTAMTATYKTIIFYWFYLMQRYYGVTLSGLKLMEYIAMGSVYTSNLSINDIPTIISDYDAIKTRPQLMAFYTKYFEEEYSKILSCKDPEIAELKETAKQLNLELYQYIEKRIDDADDKTNEIKLIMDEIYASLTLSFSNYKSNELLYKYIGILVENLTQVTTNIEATDSYKLISNLKPFHTDILDVTSNKIIVNDKFNALLMSITYDAIFNYNLVTALNLSDQINTKIPIYDMNSLSLITFQKYFIDMFFYEDIIKDYFQTCDYQMYSWSLEYGNYWSGHEGCYNNRIAVDAMQFIDKYWFKFLLHLYDQLNLKDSKWFWFIYHAYEDRLVKDSINICDYQMYSWSNDFGNFWSGHEGCYNNRIAVDHVGELFDHALFKFILHLFEVLNLGDYKNFKFDKFNYDENKLTDTFDICDYQMYSWSKDYGEHWSGHSGCYNNKLVVDAVIFYEHELYKFLLNKYDKEQVDAFFHKALYTKFVTDKLNLNDSFKTCDYQIYSWNFNYGELWSGHEGCYNNRLEVDQLNWISHPDYKYAFNDKTLLINDYLKYLFTYPQHDKYILNDSFKTCDYEMLSWDYNYGEYWSAHSGCYNNKILPENLTYTENNNFKSIFDIAKTQYSINSICDLNPSLLSSDTYTITDNFTVTIENITDGYGQLYGRYWSSTK